MEGIERFFFFFLFFLVCVCVCLALMVTVMWSLIFITSIIIMEYAE